MKKTALNAYLLLAFLVVAFVILLFVTENIVKYTITL